MCYRCSKESSHWDRSLSTHNLCFGWELRKTIFNYTLIWRPNDCKFKICCTNCNGFILFFQEILDIEHEPNQPPEDILTPPGSPPISPLRPTTEDLSFLNIPAPLSPIRDLTPPASPESSWTSSNTERHHYSRNLLSVFNEYSRDLW